MKVNYDVQFERAKSDAVSGAKLLLHVCCAPCLSYCLTRVLDKFDVTLYYANDNITNFDEWKKRLGEIEKLVDIVNNGEFEVKPTFALKLVTQPFDSQRFFAVAKGLEKEREGGARCTECFTLRLVDTLSYAIQNGFEYFGTTLTVSPYKNSQVLNQIGELLQQNVAKKCDCCENFATLTENTAVLQTQTQSQRQIADEMVNNQKGTTTYQVRWLPSDFKKNDGYNQSVQLSAKYNLYRQHYCGCCFALDFALTPNEKFE